MRAKVHQVMLCIWASTAKYFDSVLQIFHKNYYSL